MCLGASNGMAIAVSLANKRKDVMDSPYSLGRLGPFMNVLAVLWIAFEIVLFSMPAVVPVTAVTMNYASVVFVGFGVISAVWYIISGRHHYTGPPEPRELVGGEREREGSSSNSTREDAVEIEKMEKS
ncbi:hypothetical protein PM082_019934 [Marasmius tenuissimus]|nr:hypothetical protein PM082_019934 [Marasmius tenuissimus]